MRYVAIFLSLFLLFSISTPALAADFSLPAGEEGLTSDVYTLSNDTAVFSNSQDISLMANGVNDPLTPGSTGFDVRNYLGGNITTTFSHVFSYITESLYHLYSLLNDSNGLPAIKSSLSSINDSIDSLFDLFAHNTSFGYYDTFGSLRSGTFNFVLESLSLWLVRIASYSRSISDSLTSFYSSPLSVDFNSLAGASGFTGYSVYQDYLLTDLTFQQYLENLIYDVVNFAKAPGFTAYNTYQDSLITGLTFQQFLENLIFNQKMIYNGIFTFLDTTHSDLTSFSSQNHTDTIKVDTDINSFASVNHIDLSTLDSDLQDFRDRFSKAFVTDRNYTSWVYTDPYDFTSSPTGTAVTFPDILSSLSESLLPGLMDRFEDKYIHDNLEQLTEAEESLNSQKSNLSGLQDAISGSLVGGAGDFDLGGLNDLASTLEGFDDAGIDSPWYFFSQPVADSMSPNQPSAIAIEDYSSEVYSYMESCDEWGTATW